MKDSLPGGYPLGSQLDGAEIMSYIRRRFHTAVFLKTTSTRAILASSDVVAGGVFYKDRAEPVLVICQLKSMFLRKLGDLCPVIFFSYRPDALQFLLVDRAVP